MDGVERGSWHHHRKAASDHHVVLQLITVIAERDAALLEKSTAISEKMAAWAERDAALLQRDAALADRDSALLKRDAAISALAKAGKLIANLIVLGSGVLLRAVSQAYRQAIVNASKSGVAQETVQNMAHKVSKTMTEHEARQILGVSEKASWEEIMKKYDTLFENNAKTGTFYLQSKVFRAKECLEAAKQRAGERPA
ncbi:unnamed protein product [Sphagnum balticum]